jgi:hypothetical protein
MHTLHVIHAICKSFGQNTYIIHTNMHSNTYTYMQFAQGVRGMHMCMYCKYRVCYFLFSQMNMCMHLYASVSYVCACMMHVLYVLAQASTGAVTPRALRRAPHGQLPNHFIPPSGTHPLTSFRAPTRAARVGGAKARSLRSMWASLSHLALGKPAPSPVLDDLGRYSCAEASRAACAPGQKPLQTLMAG